MGKEGEYQPIRVTSRAKESGRAKAPGDDVIVSPVENIQPRSDGSGSGSTQRDGDELLLEEMIRALAHGNKRKERRLRHEVVHDPSLRESLLHPGKFTLASSAPVSFGIRSIEEVPAAKDEQT